MAGRRPYFFQLCTILDTIPFRVWVLESTGIDNEARLPHFGKWGVSRRTAFERDYGDSFSRRNKDREVAESLPCQSINPRLAGLYALAGLAFSF